MSYLDNFHYRIMGPTGSPRLVFLHGLMGFSSNWQRIARDLEGQYEILIYDQRGHGRSFHPDQGGYSPQDYAEDLVKILDELGWEKINLVGHSMGGRAALFFGSHYSDRVEKLVIEDIGASTAMESMTALRQMLLSLPVPFASRDAARNYFEREFHEVHGARFETQSLGPYFMANLKTLEDGSLHWRFSLKGVLESLEQGRSRTMWPEWDSLQVSTLLIRGTESEMLPEEVFWEMLERQSRAKGVQIGAGHWVHSEQPEDFIRALRSFLEGDGAS